MCFSVCACSRASVCVCVCARALLHIHIVRCMHSRLRGLVYVHLRIFTPSLTNGKVLVNNKITLPIFYKNILQHILRMICLKSPCRQSDGFCTAAPNLSWEAPHSRRQHNAHFP